MHLRLLSLYLVLSASLLAQTVQEATKLAPSSKTQDAATDFIRVEHSEKNSKLQTAIIRYSKHDTLVDLIGAVHIADKSYYTHLNTVFKSYDVLLFEMIGGENIGKGKPIPKKEENDDRTFSFLNSAYATMQAMLALEGQKDHIDYGAKNFVHADLTLERFHQLQRERKESLFSFMLKQSLKPQKGPQPSTAGLLFALFSKNPDRLKLQLIDTLGEGDNQMGSIAGENVIITDRNIKCLTVMQNQLKAGKKRIGIFYGAAHFPDMEKRLLKQGFKKGTVNWIDAWTIQKQQKIAPLKKP